MDPIDYGTEPAEAAVASGRPCQPHPLLGLARPIPQPLLDCFEVLEGRP